MNSRLSPDSCVRLPRRVLTTERLLRDVSVTFLELGKNPKVQPGRGPSVAAGCAVLYKKLKVLALTRTHSTRVVVPADALQKGGVPATPSGTATLLRLSPNYLFRPYLRVIEFFDSAIVPPPLRIVFRLDTTFRL